MTDYADMPLDDVTFSAPPERDSDGFERTLYYERNSVRYVWICPDCHRLSTEGHADDCPIASAP